MRGCVAVNNGVRGTRLNPKVRFGTVRYMTFGLNCSAITSAVRGGFRLRGCEPILRTRREPYRCAKSALVVFEAQIIVHESTKNIEHLVYSKSRTWIWIEVDLPFRTNLVMAMLPSDRLRPDTISPRGLSETVATPRRQALNAVLHASHHDPRKHARMRFHD